MAADFIAGTVGGLAGVLVGHPFDTVKVRLQMQNARAPKYSGIFNCFATIVRQESLFGLFKGMASPLVGLTFVNTLVFGVQGNVLRQFDEPSAYSHFLAGAMAGGVQSIVSGPMELGKVRVQVQHRHLIDPNLRYTGSLDALKKIYHVEGFRGCYRGFILTVLRDTPGYAIVFMSYELFSSKFAEFYSDGQVGMIGLMMAGGFSGMMSWLLTYSLDVMKTRVQADGVGGKNEYNGVIDVFRKSYQQEGHRVMVKGLGTTLLRAFPVNAAIFAGAALTYEVIGDNNGNGNGK